MDVRNCKMCRRLFNYSGNPICPACEKKMEDKFEDVRKYLRENPSSSISMVSEETEVPMQQLKRWIREERLTFSKNSGISIQCEKCGAEILTGRYCAKCKKTMTQSFEGLYNQNSPKAKKVAESAKMRFINQ